MIKTKKTTLAALLLLAGIASRPAEGEDFVNLTTREVWSADWALAEGKLLVYVTKDCPACRAYTARLAACPEVGARLRYVALESPARAREMQNKLTGTPDLAVRRLPGEGPPIKATPFTRGAASSKPGLLTCEELRTFR